MTAIGLALILIGIGLLIVGWFSNEPPISWLGYPGIALALLGGYLLNVF